MAGTFAFIAMGLMVGLAFGIVLGALMAWKPRATMAGMVAVLAVVVGSLMLLPPEQTAGAFIPAYHLSLMVGSAIGSPIGYDVTAAVRSPGVTV